MNDTIQGIESDQSSYAGIANVLDPKDPTKSRQATLYRKIPSDNARYWWASVYQRLLDNSRIFAEQQASIQAANSPHEPAIAGKKYVPFAALLGGLAYTYVARGDNEAANVDAAPSSLVQQLMRRDIDDVA